jgi:hypothetical protein
MSFDKLVEALIKEAQERGEFDHLPGKGKPINLTSYFETPEDIRLAQSVLKNAGMIAPEVELLKEIEELKHLLAEIADNQKKEAIRRQIRDKQIDFDLMMERKKPHRRENR